MNSLFKKIYKETIFIMFEKRKSKTNILYVYDLFIINELIKHMSINEKNLLFFKYLKYYIKKRRIPYKLY